jgi:hypothetical protein
MTKQALIQKTVETLEKLPEDKVSEIATFAEFLLKTYEDYILRKGVSELNSNSKSFEFLNDEEELYTLDDLKERYK